MDFYDKVRVFFGLPPRGKAPETPPKKKYVQKEFLRILCCMQNVAKRQIDKDKSARPLLMYPKFLENKNLSSNADRVLRRVLRRKYTHQYSSRFPELRIPVFIQTGENYNVGCMLARLFDPEDDYFDDIDMRRSVYRISDRNMRSEKEFDKRNDLHLTVEFWKLDIHKKERLGVLCTNTISGNVYDEFFRLSNIHDNGYNIPVGGKQKFCKYLHRLIYDREEILVNIDGHGWGLTPLFSSEMDVMAGLCVESTNDKNLQFNVTAIPPNKESDTLTSSVHSVITDAQS